MSKVLAAMLMAVVLSALGAAQAAAPAGPAASGPPGAASALLPDGATALPPVAATAAASAASASEGVRSSRFRIRPVDDAWRHSLPRDADQATQAYLDRLPPDVVKSSNDYYEGGYWLILWNFVVGLVTSWIILGGRRSARVRDWCQRVGRVGFVRDALYGGFFALASFVISLPLTIYQGFVREHQYEMATQTFGPWFGEQITALVVTMIAFAIAAAALYAIIRAAGERWWLWGTVGMVAFMVVSILVSPIWIEPLFNTYRPVSDPTIRAAVLQMAQADGVPVTNVYEFDASRQTTRVSANVSGIFGTAAVRLNDNLMKCTLPEIRAVMGHELGHYVMNHVYKSIVELAVVMLAAFLFAQWAMGAMLRRHGERWGLRGVSDVASLPLFIAVFSVFFFFATPIMNTLVRTQEIEADRFGLNLAREPHGEAEADLKLVEYRKADPGPIEEFVFFDHPSTRFRIHDAMRWRQQMGVD